MIHFVVSMLCPIPSLKSKNKQRAITPKLGKAELQFLCSALLLSKVNGNTLTSEHYTLHLSINSYEATLHYHTVKKNIIHVQYSKICIYIKHYLHQHIVRNNEHSTVVFNIQMYNYTTHYALCDYLHSVCTISIIPHKCGSLVPELVHIN